MNSDRGCGVTVTVLIKKRKRIHTYTPVEKWRELSEVVQGYLGTPEPE